MRSAEIHHQQEQGEVFNPPGLFEELAPAFPGLLELGSDRAQGLPIRPLPWKLLQTRLEEQGNEAGDRDPDGVTLEWPDDIDQTFTEDELPKDPILEQRIKELFEAERKQIRSGTVDGVKDGERTDDAEDAADVEEEAEFRADVEVDSEGMGASVELAGPEKQLGFKSRIRLRIMEERQREKREADQRASSPSARKTARDLEAEFSRLDEPDESDEAEEIQEQEPLDLHTEEGLAALFQMEVPPVPPEHPRWHQRRQDEGRGEIVIDDMPEYERNSSEISNDFLFEYPELKKMRDLIVSSAYDWIAQTVDSVIQEDKTEDGNKSAVKSGKKMEQLRWEIERGVNTVFFGLAVDIEQLKRQSDQSVLARIGAYAGKLKALQQTAKDMGGESYLSAEELKSLVTSTVEELAPQYEISEGKTESRLSSVSSASNGDLLDFDKLERFSYAGLNMSDISTKYGASRHLARRALRLVSDDLNLKQDPPRPAKLVPALSTLERLAMQRGTGPAQVDNREWAAAYFQGHVLGGVSALYALRKCFGEELNLSQGDPQQEQAA